MKSRSWFRWAKQVIDAVANLSGSTFTTTTWNPAANSIATATLTLTTKDGDGVAVPSVPVTFTTLRTFVSAALSVVTTNVTAIANDGVGSAVCTVTVVDANGTPLPGIPAANCVLAVSGTGNTVTQPTGVTDANGQISGSFVSTVSANKTVSFTILSQAVTDTANVLVAANNTVQTFTDISRDAANTAGGTLVYLTVSDIIGTPTVTFGGVSATSVTVVNSTTISCVTPATTAGIKSVVCGGVTLTNPRAGKIGGGFEILPVATTTFVDTGFEGGVIPASMSTDIGGGGSVTVQTSEKYSGTYAVKCSYNGDGPALIQNNTGIVVSSEANGVYIRCYQYVPSVANVQASGKQIKTYLSRILAGGGQPGWVMTGVGYDFSDGGSNNTLVSFVDNGILSISGGSSGVTVTAWREVIYWQQWDAGNSRGNFKMWIDGKLQFNTFNASAGGTGTYFNRLGVAYAQTSGNVDVYIDSVFMGNGFPDTV